MTEWLSRNLRGDALSALAPELGGLVDDEFAPAVSSARKPNSHLPPNTQALRIGGNAARVYHGREARFVAIEMTGEIVIVDLTRNRVAVRVPLEKVVNFDGANVDVRPDQWLAMSGGYDGAVRVYNLVTGETTALGRHNSKVSSVAFSRNADFAVSGDIDGLVKVWHTRSKTVIREVRLNSEIVWLRFCKSGRLIATCHSAGECTVIDRVNSSVTTIAHERRNPMMRLEFVAGGRYIVAVHRFGTLVRYDVSSGVKCILAPKLSSLSRIEMADEASLIVSPRTVMDPPRTELGVWDVHSGQLVKSIRETPLDHSVTANGDKLAVLTTDYEVELYSGLNLNKRDVFGFGEHLFNVSLRPDGTYFNVSANKNFFTCYLP